MSQLKNKGKAESADNNVSDRIGEVGLFDAGRGSNAVGDGKRDLLAGKRCVAFLLGSGLGSRMGELTKDKPKQLLRLDEDGQLQSTILGRLVHQLQNQSVSRIILLSGHFHTPFVEWLEDQRQAGNLKVPVEVIKREEAQEGRIWMRVAQSIRDNITEDEYALIIRGDLVVDERNVKKVKTKTERLGRRFLYGRLGDSLPRTHKHVPHYDYMCWATDKEAVEDALDTGPHYFYEWLKLMWSIKRVGVSVGRPYVNVNRPQDMELARDLVKRGIIK